MITVWKDKENGEAAMSQPLTDYPYVQQVYQLFSKFYLKNGFNLQPEQIFVVYKGERPLLQNKEETKVCGFWKGKIAYGRQRDCKAILGSQ